LKLWEYHSSTRRQSHAVTILLEQTTSNIIITMSLVGLNVSFDGAGIDLEPTTNSGSSDNDDLVEVHQQYSKEDHHPCVTPPGPAEMLFMCNLPTQIISAAALAQQIHIAHSQRSAGTSTLASDDFCTAVSTAASSSPDMTLLSPTCTFNDSPSSNNKDSPFSNGSSSTAPSLYQRNIFPKDVLTQTFTTTIQDHQEEEDRFLDATMTTTQSFPTISKKIFPPEAPQHVDAAEKVYDTAKSVWAWGKGVGIIHPILGMAEHVASKAVGTTGQTMEGIDGIVIDQLHGLDDQFLNPAIAALVGLLLQAAGKSEEILMPILLPMLIQFKLIKVNAETPEVTPDVAVTE
jgi:hypothetical protein